MWKTSRSPYLAKITHLKTWRKTNLARNSGLLILYLKIANNSGIKSFCKRSSNYWIQMIFLLSGCYVQFVSQFYYYYFIIIYTYSHNWIENPYSELFLQNLILIEKSRSLYEWMGNRISSHFSWLWSEESQKLIGNHNELNVMAMRNRETVIIGLEKYIL